MNEPHDTVLDEQLRSALGSPARPDFEEWQRRHGDAVAHLNPVVTGIYRRRRRLLMRIASGAVAAAVVVGVLVPFLGTDRVSFAETVEAIDNAETITWTVTTYTRLYSEDGKRTWLRTEPRMETAYLAPDLYRDTRYDKEGNVRSVQIVDTRSNRTLHLDMKSKTATWKSRPTNSYGPGSPFAWVATVLKGKPVEWVGQREVDGRAVNVFRYRREGPHLKSVDIWLDAESKKLVGFSEPSSDVFDPATAPDRNNPAEEKFSKGELAGGIWGNIVFDAKLDPKLFSLTPPEGFEVVHEPAAPSVTEEQMVEWLGVTARFNNGMFTDTARGVDHEIHNKAAAKDKAQRTQAEQRYLDLWFEHVVRNHHSYPILDFADAYAVPGSFRYLGKGVKLGAADRIVCWYKLKSTGTYRAVYGDLTVKDVDPKELPLPVEE
jgi:outer membrane lipoprotein-sorting protein